MPDPGFAGTDSFTYQSHPSTRLLIRGVKGRVAYTLIRTEDGGVTVTVCKDKAGADESIKVARDWIKQNAPDIGAKPPAVSEGKVILHLK